MIVFYLFYNKFLTLKIKILRIKFKYTLEIRKIKHLPIIHSKIK